MAEYCDIQARITHDDPKMRQRLIDAYRRCRVGQEFLPLAKRFLRSERYCVRREIRWGTPEDFGQGEYSAAPVRHKDGIKFVFETVNRPPLGVFIELRRLGFAVEANYWEPSSGICGYLRGDRFDESAIRCWRPACIRRHLDRGLVKLFGMDDGRFHSQSAPCDHDGSPWNYSRGRTIEEYVVDRTKATQGLLVAWEKLLA